MTADGSLLLAESQIQPPLLPRPGCFTLRLPDGLWAPLVFSSPHSGRLYDPAFLASSRLDALTLRRSEDCYIDEIFAGVPAQGAPLLAAEFPRAWCDPNREPWELDPNMFEDALPAWVNTGSPRVAAGLGTIARVVATGAAIYRGRLRFADAEQRVAACWEPYHGAISALIGHLRASYPACLLVDCHSMPAHAFEGRRPAPDIVLGDAHGGSCSTGIIRHVEHFLTRRGYVVRRNDPYAGGYVTRFYGKPAGGTHALQIEIARGLYMNENNLDKLPGLARVSRDMTDLAASLAAEAGRLMAMAPD